MLLLPSLFPRIPDCSLDEPLRRGLIVEIINSYNFPIGPLRRSYVAEIPPYTVGSHHNLVAPCLAFVPTKTSADAEWFAAISICQAQPAIAQPDHMRRIPSVPSRRLRRFRLQGP